MEHLTQIAHLIAEIGTTSSQTDKKLKLIRGVSMYEDSLTSLLLAAYNPFTTYGIKQIPEPTEFYGGISTHAWNNVLTSLAERSLTGNEAQRVVGELLKQTYNKQQAALLINILKKDLRFGMRAKSINKALKDTKWKKLIPTFDIMLASDDISKVKFPCYVEPKLDGVRCIASIDPNSNPVLFSRSGQVFENFPTIVKALTPIDKCWVFDGEIVAVDGNFQDLMTQVRRKDKAITVKVRYIVFDGLPYDQFITQKATLTFEERKDAWKTLRFNTLWDTDYVKHITELEPLVQVVTDTKMLDRAIQTYLTHGYEGAVIKDPKALYKCTRSTGWIKVKPTQTFDLFVAKVVEGTGKNKGKVGALDCRFYHADSQVTGVSVGSGLVDWQRVEWWVDPTQIVNRWIEVKAQEVTRDGSLRSPIFLRVREDKE